MALGIYPHVDARHRVRQYPHDCPLDDGDDAHPRGGTSESEWSDRSREWTHFLRGIGILRTRRRETRDGLCSRDINSLHDRGDAPPHDTHVPE